MEAGKKTIDQAIQQLVSQHPIPDQATLITLLTDEGFNLTQGTLSRRLAKLSIHKRGGRYQRVASPAMPIPPYTIAKSSPNILVLQTHLGLGHALALRVDRNTVRGIAGTVAGEDALLVAIHCEATLQEVQDQVVQLLGPPLATL